MNTTGTGGIGVVLDSSKQLQAGVQQYILIELRSVAARIIIRNYIQLPGANPGEGLWGLKPPPSKLMIFISS